MASVEDDSDRLRRLGMSRPITRRDFIDGIAVAAVAATSSSPLLAAVSLDGARTAAQDGPGYYPPALSGMRGSHPGSFEAAHTLRDGTFLKSATTPLEPGERYDLIVVGGGISGLAAAYFYRAKAGADTRILILDNHDDFGGHAKRNEFQLGGKIQLINGGTLEIDSPRPYSSVAAGLLSALGIDPAALASRHADPGFYSSLAMGFGFFFDKETFGEDRLVKGKISSSEFLEHAPISETARRDIRRLETAPIDYLPGLSSSEKKARLSRISYRDFLLNLVKVDPSVIPLYQSRTHGEWGVGIDAVSALDVWPFGLPGFQGLKLDPGSAPHMGYTAAGYADGGSSKFHFPDGNASIARLLVRSLIPEAVPGSTAEDIVTARIDYGRLDPAGGGTRIRVGSTALSVGTRGTADAPAAVEVVYSRTDDLYTASAKHCCTRLLEYDDPVSLSAIAGAAERGIALPGQSAAGLYECSAVQLASVSRIGSFRGPLSGQLSFQRPAKSGYRYRQLPLAALAG